MKTVVSACAAAALALMLLPCVATAQSRSPSDQGQSRPSPSASSEASKYVERTWEISSSDYAIKQGKDEDGLLVYRVTLRPDNKIALALFRVIDIYVDPGTSAVVGERHVR